MNYWISVLLISVIYSNSYVQSKILDTCECGRGNSATGARIINGKSMTPHRYPWLVALMFNRIITCGASLITNKHVLTAAHCVDVKFKIKEVKIVVGMHGRLNSGLRFNYAKHYLSPFYSKKATYDHGDMAIIEVDGKIRFTNKIRPICMPSPDDYVDDVRKAVVAGWGVTSSGNRQTHRVVFPLETTIHTIRSDVCKKSQFGPYFDPKTMLCGYAKKSDACQGDSGGPLFSQVQYNVYEQIGVVSFGMGCALDNIPSGFSRISQHLAWIKKVTQDADTCKHP